MDDVLVKVMKKLGLEIPEYSNDIDPTKSAGVVDWTIKKEDIREIKQLYNIYCKKQRKRKSIDKTDENFKKADNIKSDCKVNLTVLKEKDS